MEHGTRFPACCFTAAVCVTLLALTAGATTCYVSPSGDDGNLGSNWATAVQTIQRAVNVSASNGLIWVTNGTYASGSLSGNRVCITNAMMIRSVNGPQYTTIDGGSTVRCCYVSSGASLSGFLLTGGNTPSNGGGAYCEPGAVISNSVIASNTAGLSGGGVCHGSVFNSLIKGNSAASGGGAAGCELQNCTVVHNSASLSGGVEGGTNWNCIVAFNWPSNYVASPPVHWIYSCTTPNPSVSNSISADPQFQNETNDDFHLRSSSPCVNAGMDLGWMTNATDLDGNPRIANDRVDMGCFESSGTNSSGSGWAVQTTSYRTFVTVISYSDGLGLFRYEFYRGLPNPDFAFCFTPGNGSIPLQVCLATNVDCPPGWAASISPRNVTLYSINSSGSWLADAHVIFDIHTSARGWTSLRSTMSAPFCQKYNSGNCGSGSEYFDYVAPTSPPYSYWEWADGITNGLTNFDDSATGDGYPNLLKYATGGSPINTDNVAQLNTDASKGSVSVSFNRNTNAADTVLIVEGADSLTNGTVWNGIATNINGSWGGATNVAEIGTTNPLTVEVQDPDFAGTATSRYLRLHVTRP